MKNVLIIGSLVSDVIVRIPHLPITGEDLHIEKQSLSLGGCAGNVAIVLDALHVPYDLFAPIGQGIYGDYVYKELEQRGMHSMIPRSEEHNGCCYCMVEYNGERTFLSDHGAEYRFLPEWFDLIDPSQYEHVYVCGLELEEESGSLIIEHLSTANYSYIYFAPGPRIHHIPSERLQAMFDFHCILHLNEAEACQYTNETTVEKAAQQLYEKTQNLVIITRGERGCLVYEHDHMIEIPSSFAHVKDTIGAGDSHIAAFIAAFSNALTPTLSATFANLCSHRIVEQQGVTLSDDQIDFLNSWLNEKKSSS